jgi:DnaA family protein
MAIQLPLDITLRDSATFENFIASRNEQIIDALQKFARAQGEAFVYLAGKPGTGRTHLLQAVCHGSGEHGLCAAYLPLEQHQHYAPEMLEGWENFQIICLDDIDAVAGKMDWEQALFHLFNRVRESGGHLVVTAAMMPSQLPCVLPDLQSRLGWGLALNVTELQDDDKIVALQKRAAERGLELPQDVANYLLRRCPRDMATLLAMLRELDTQSLAAQRRLTIPFVRELLPTE